jgi:hypothetical protein
MRTVQELYSQYKILPSLQLHQLRVAAVAKKIVEHFDGALDKEAIITACLFHDMGNIIKSDLERFPDFVKPEGIEYWEEVKKDFITRYGSDDHVATDAIAKEIGFAPNILLCLANTGISKASQTEASDSFELKICEYSDMRVGPYGVLPMEERIADLRVRYGNKKHVISSDQFEALVESLRGIEKQIFARTSIAPGDITDEGITGTIEDLRGREV